MKCIVGVYFCGSTIRDDNSGYEPWFVTLRELYRICLFDKCGPKEVAVTVLGKLYDQVPHIFGFTWSDEIKVEIFKGRDKLAERALLDSCWFIYLAYSLALKIFVRNIDNFYRTTLRHIPEYRTHEHANLYETCGFRNGEDYILVS